MISLEKIMTKDVVTVGRTADIYDAIRMMADGNITGLPVVDEDEKLVGVVTEKDVMSEYEGQGPGLHDYRCNKL
jgi:CBS domain-containing protein